MAAREIDAVYANFPLASRPRSVVMAMVEIDEVFDHFKEIQKGDMIAPCDHPGLVPVALCAKGCHAKYRD